MYVTRWEWVKITYSKIFAVPLIWTKSAHHQEAEEIRLMQSTACGILPSISLLLTSSSQLSHVLIFVSVMARSSGSGCSRDKIESDLRREMSSWKYLGSSVPQESPNRAGHWTVWVRPAADSVCLKLELPWSALDIKICLVPPGWVWRSLGAQVLWKVVWQFPGAVLFWKKCV